MASIPLGGPTMSRWIVPQGETRTMFIEFRQVSETDGVTPAWWAPSSMTKRRASSGELGQRIRARLLMASTGSLCRVRGRLRAAIAAGAEDAEVTT